MNPAEMRRPMPFRSVPSPSGSKIAARAARQRVTREAHRQQPEDDRAAGMIESLRIAPCVPEAWDRPPSAAVAARVPTST